MLVLEISIENKNLTHYSFISYFQCPNVRVDVRAGKRNIVYHSTGTKHEECGIWKV